MASRALSSFTTKPAPLQLPHSTTSPAGSLRFPQQRKPARRSVVVAAATAGSKLDDRTHIRAVQEVKKADLAIPITAHVSLARQRYAQAFARPLLTNKSGKLHPTY